MNCLQISDLKVGDVLEWDSSSAMKRSGRVNRIDAGWIYVGDQNTPRQQDWLDIPKVNVRKILSAT